jgi:competence protein ComEC
VTLVGLIGVALGAASIPAASVAAGLAGAAAAPVAWVATLLAGAPGAWLPWPQGWWGAAAMAVVSAAAVWSTTARTVNASWRVTAGLLCAGLVVAVPAVERAGAPAHVSVADWDVVVCDVGQGHMMMVRAGPHQAVVIDVGAAGQGALECLSRHEVTAIPLLVLTHPHGDHDGAVAEVVDAVPVGRAWVSPAALRDGHGRARTTLKEAAVEVSVPTRGHTVQVGWVTVNVWHPSAGTAAENVGLNDASVAVVGRTREVTFANLGDLELHGQRVVASALPPMPVIDVVMMAHHGSATQHPPLIEALAARIAVAGVGADNRHGHPAASAVELYERHGATVVRTDQCGDVAIARRPPLVLSTGCRDLMAG